MDAVTAHGRETIRAGSKSFAAASRLFDRRTRESAWRLYAWCRHCDDVIDGQVLGHGMAVPGEADARARLEALREKTGAALDGEAAGDPAFEAFAQVMRAHAVPERHAFELLDGFAMDVEGRTYATLQDTLDYCYHVAGVVGVMMARIMGVSDEPTLDRASDLGLAFQLTNIARDVMEDAAAGRVYLPADWLAEAGLEASAVARPESRAAVFAATLRLLGEADRYYASGRVGIARLPFRSAWAVAAARGVYREIGREVLRRGPSAWDARVATSGGRKAWLAATGGGAALAAVMLGRRRPLPMRAGLWKRPTA
jgi:15-cis-phytoene synthase